MSTDLVGSKAPACGHVGCLQREPKPGTTSRPALPETALCAGCGHPLASHNDGLHNPYYWLGPEWPLGCEHIVGFDEAGSCSCSCRRFEPPKAE